MAQLQGTVEGPSAQGPVAADHRAHVGRAANGVRGQRDGGVRVVRAGRHAALAERRGRDLRAVHNGRVLAVRAHRGQVRAAAAVHGVVRGHHRVPRDHCRRAVHGTGRERPGGLAAVGQRVRRRVLHQHRADAAADRRPVRVLPVRHPGPGQLRGRVHHHAHVHRRAQAVPARHRDVRQARELHRLRGGHAVRRHVLLPVGARDQGQVVPADPDGLRDVRVARPQGPPEPDLRTVLIAALAGVLPQLTRVPPRPRPVLVLTVGYARAHKHTHTNTHTNTLCLTHTHTQITCPASR